MKMSGMYRVRARLRSCSRDMAHGILRDDGEKLREIKT